MKMGSISQISTKVGLLQRCGAKNKIKIKPFKCSLSAYHVTKVICDVTLYYSHCNMVLLSRELYYYVFNSKKLYVNMKNKVDFI